MSYWANRQKQLNQAAEKEESKLKKRLSKYYDSEFRKLEKQIAAYYQEYGENMGNREYGENRESYMGKIRKNQNIMREQMYEGK